MNENVTCELLNESGLPREGRRSRPADAKTSEMKRDMPILGDPSQTPRPTNGKEREEKGKGGFGENLGRSGKNGPRRSGAAAARLHFNKEGD